MRFAMIVVVMVACGGSGQQVQPDALDVDAVPIDARPEFFGEICDLPNIPMYPGAIAVCHNNQGFCVDEDQDGDFVGKCRPWCDQISPNWNPKYTCLGPRHGGRPWWTSDGTTTSKPYVCVCLPPE